MNILRYARYLYIYIQPCEHFLHFFYNIIAVYIHLIFSFFPLTMVEPVTITLIAVGTAMILASVIAALGIALAPAVSSPEDKYVYSDDYLLAYGKT